MTLLNLLDIDVASAASSGLVELLRIWRNLRVVYKFLKIKKNPSNGAGGANRRKLIDLSTKESSPESEPKALEAGHASAIKLKNAKAAPHSVVASAREHKDDDDEDADGDDADGSGAN
jgi:hypothetical protein